MHVALHRLCCVLLAKHRPTNHTAVLVQRTTQQPAIRDKVAEPATRIIRRVCCVSAEAHHSESSALANSPRPSLPRNSLIGPLYHQSLTSRSSRTWIATSLAVSIDWFPMAASYYCLRRHMMATTTAGRIARGCRKRRHGYRRMRRGAIV